MTKNFLVFIVTGFCLVVCFRQAKAAGPVYYSEDTTVTLGGIDYLILAGSDADEISVLSGDTLAVTISPGQQFILKSPDRKKLTNDSGYQYDCTDTYSQLTISVSGSQQVIQITPESECVTPTSTPNITSGSGGNLTANISQSVPAQPLVSRATPAQFNLREGALVSVGGNSDPDIFIINNYGYKRLFLNPIIFSFYGHLGGFKNVKLVVATTRDAFETSLFFKNCETNKPDMYVLEVTTEDGGTLHRLDTPAVREESFLKKVFCINNSEFTWYSKGSTYTSLDQIPAYKRTNNLIPAPDSGIGKFIIKIDGGSANIREKPDLGSRILGKFLEGKIIEVVGKQGQWYKIKFNKKYGWVRGDLLKKLK